MEREEHAKDRMTTADIASGGDKDVRAEDSESGEGIQRENDERTEVDVVEPLIGDDETRTVQARWEQVQVSFVDEPRRAVEEADTLVAELMQRLADSFAQERKQLEGQWDKGDEVSTEDLRVALQRYRSFFTRLLSA
jgi:hypothetical protein